MTLREKLLPWLTWRLGNGKKCRAFAQPWAPGMMEINPQNAMQRKLTVNELVEVPSNTWDIGRLIELFGFQQSVQIVTHVLPPIAPDEEDRLIFTAASHGSFSVKKAYIKLGELQATTQGGNSVSTQLEKEKWRIIWRKGYVLPRLRLFLWKLVNRALPLGAVIAARTSRGDATCAVCGEEVEDANHMMFLCSFARSCWFAGPLPLQSDSFNGDLHYNLVQMARILTDEQWTTMVNCMWSIWRCRNDRAYGGKIPSFQSFIAYFQKVNSETQIGKSGTKHSKFTRHSPNISQLPEVGINSYTCFTDGSWIMDWNGGMGFIISKGETLIAYRTAGILSSCPMQSEAKALLEAMKYVVLSGISSCRFCTDNLSLSKAISSIQPPIETEWRALEETMQIWKLMKENTGFECSHVSRDENGKADKLAKMGSTKGLAWDCMGYSYPMFLGF